ncbi:MAG: cytosine permease, partial [Pseudonocardia sp.]|nr:cytosine permease [Pseudonocardia sp.]
RRPRRGSPGWCWSGLVSLALTLYLQHGDLAPRFTNVMLLASYWVGPFVGIVAGRWWQRPSTAGLAATAASAIRALPARPHAVAALLAGFLACLPFSNTTLGTDLAARHAVLNALLGSVSRGVLHGADLAYPVGLLAGGGVYLWLEGVGALRTIRAARVPSLSAGQTP